MPRKLKTYITNLGFFELALAAPSMKAALEAWGMGHNAFHQGFARETDDPRIVAATMAQPGIVLQRPVGTKGAFTENAELPKQLWTLTPPKTEPPRPKTSKRAKSPAKSKTAKADQADRAAVISFEKAKEHRTRQREKEEAEKQARLEKERAQTERAIAKADEALERAQKRHDEIAATIEKDQEKLDRRMEDEKTRWEAEKTRLKEARTRATE